MNTKKVLLGSLALAGAITACTNEEIVDAAQNNAVLAERTQVNLTLNAPSVESRMVATQGGWGVGYETFDLIGAVLVDEGYQEDGWMGVNWGVIDGHVGNNKWAFNSEKGKFMTEGTTSVGSWLFYTKYNPAMTTARNGVEFNFPQIQEGAKDLDWVANNNINFQISPIAHIDGYEGQNLEFDIRMASVFNYLRMPFDFSEIGAKYVQKIIVTAKDASGNAVKFPTEYKVVNTNVPQAKMLLGEDAPTELACPRVVDNTDLMDLNAAMKTAYDTLTYAKSVAIGANDDEKWDNLLTIYKDRVISRNTAKDVDFLVVDFESDHAEGESKGGLAVAEDGKFSAVMLMPAGVYGAITFDIFTDKGIYTTTVDSQNEYIAYDTNNGNDSDVKGQDKVFLRPGRVAVLSDVRNGVFNEYTAETLADGRYIPVTTTSTQNNYITKTADLVNFIKGIQTSGNYDVYMLNQAQVGEDLGEEGDAVIPEHAAIINKYVMAAIEEKEAEKGDIQLIFKNAEIVIEGNEEDALDIHDLTFDKDAKITKGLVKATADVVLPGSVSQGLNSKLIVDGNSTLELSMNNTSNATLNVIDVKEGSNLIVSSNNVLTKIVNNGNVKIGSKDNKTASIIVGSFPNYGETRNFGDLTINTSFVNYPNASLITAGNLTIKGAAENKGTIANSSKINVKGSLTNNNIITVGTNGEVVVNSETAGSLINETTGEITNNGDIYTVVESGTNVIYNYGLINAKEGSLTYITRNSYEDEKSSKATNEVGQKMGTIRMDKRNANMSVTEKNYQGYKEYTVNATDLTEGVLSAVAKDKFNKIVLADAAELSAEVAAYVRYIETSGTSLTLPSGARIQEATFASDVEFYCEPQTAITEKAVIAKLTVKEGVKLTVPTENEMNVTDITGLANSKTNAQIINEGTILVGGNFYTKLAKDATKTANPNGVFASGDGSATAFHWLYF